MTTKQVTIPAPVIQREALAEMIRHYYRTVGEDHITAAAEDGLVMLDKAFFALERLVGSNRIEGDLFGS